MPVPTYGAPPLAKSFLFIRILQLICFVIIIGITANFVSEIVATNHSAPREIVGTVTVASLACLYCLITIPFFWAQANIGLLVIALMDFLLLIAFVVVSVVLGKPLASLDCPIITSDPMALLETSDAYDFTQSLGSNLNKYAGFYQWSGATKGICFASKAAWGTCVALCILFASSVLILPALFAKQKRAAKTPAKV